MSLDRSRPPAAGRLRPFAFPDFERSTLAPGLELCLLPRPGVPLAHLELLLPRGADAEPRERRGLATLVASLLDEGTERRSALDIAAAVEALGTRLTTTADWDGTYLATTVPSRHLEEGLEILADVARHPSFPQREVDRLRRQRLAELRRRSTEPEFLAGQALTRAIYGRHVYGETLLGLPETVAAVDRDAAATWYTRELAATPRVLLAIGDVDAVRLSAAGASLAPDAVREPAAPDLTPPPLRGRRVVIVDRPDASQTELRIGHAGIAVAHPDRIPLQVANTLLGGKFTSRINLSLRERLGITYGAHSRLAARRGPGAFVVGAAVTTEAVGRAAREILAELERLRDEPLPWAEVEEAKSYLIGTFPYTLQTLDGLAGHLEEIFLHRLPDRYFHDLPAAVAAVDPARAQAAARAHLRPDELVIAAVGPARDLRPQLAELGAPAAI